MRALRSGHRPPALYRHVLATDQPVPQRAARSAAHRAPGRSRRPGAAGRPPSGQDQGPRPTPRQCRFEHSTWRCWWRYSTVKRSPSSYASPFARSTTTWETSVPDSQSRPSCKLCCAYCATGTSRWGRIQVRNSLRRFLDEHFDLLDGGLLEQGAGVLLKGLRNLAVEGAWRPDSSGKASKTPNEDGPKRMPNQRTVSGSCWTSESPWRRQSATSCSRPGIASMRTSSATLTSRVMVCPFLVVLSPAPGGSAALASRTGCSPPPLSRYAVGVRTSGGLRGFGEPFGDGCAEGRESSGPQLEVSCPSMTTSSSTTSASAVRRSVRLLGHTGVRYALDLYLARSVAYE